MTHSDSPLHACAALRLHDPVDPERLREQLGAAWRALGSQRCAVHVSVVESCARLLPQREAEALRLVALEAHRPWVETYAAGLRATLMVIDAPHDHILLLHSHGASGRRALQSIIRTLRTLYHHSALPLPETQRSTKKRSPSEDCTWAETT
jgi:hypothetical protein